MGKARSFRLYTARGRKRKHYYRVLIFPDVDRMRRYWTEQGIVVAGSSGGHDWQARATGWVAQYVLRRGRWRKTNCVGEILFHSGNVGSGIVSHEMTHAAHYTLRQKWAHYNTPYRDEKLAWLQGWLVYQFWVNYYRLFPHQEPAKVSS